VRARRRRTTAAGALRARSARAESPIKRAGPPPLLGSYLVPSGRHRGVIALGQWRAADLQLRRTWPPSRPSGCGGGARSRRTPHGPIWRRPARCAGASLAEPPNWTASGRAPAPLRRGRARPTRLGDNSAQLAPPAPANHFHFHFHFQLELKLQAGSVPHSSVGLASGSPKSLGRRAKEGQVARSREPTPVSMCPVLSGHFARICASSCALAARLTYLGRSLEASNSTLTPLEQQQQQQTSLSGASLLRRRQLGATRNHNLWLARQRETDARRTQSPSSFPQFAALLFVHFSSSLLLASLLLLASCLLLAACCLLLVASCAHRVAFAVRSASQLDDQCASWGAVQCSRASLAVAPKSRESERATCARPIQGETFIRRDRE